METNRLIIVALPFFQFDVCSNLVMPVHVWHSKKHGRTPGVFGGILTARDDGLCIIIGSNTSHMNRIAKFIIL